jgi:hypothetical protein
MNAQSKFNSISTRDSGVVQLTQTGVLKTADSGTSRPSSQAAQVQVVVPSAKATLPATRRLVVLIPEGTVNESRLARTIWTLALPNRLSVLYLGLGKDYHTEHFAQRNLDRLAAITRDACVHVETQLYLENDWLQVIRDVSQAGDLFICHGEQTISSWGFWRKPLAQTLTTVLDVPVMALSGFYPEWPPRVPKQPARTLINNLPIAIGIVFMGLQLLIQVSTQGAAYTVLMVLSVVAEFGLLGVWNAFFNH